MILQNKFNIVICITRSDSSSTPSSKQHAPSQPKKSSSPYAQTSRTRYKSTTTYSMSESLDRLSVASTSDQVSYNYQLSAYKFKPHHHPEHKAQSFCATNSKLQKIYSPNLP